jgi:hypothetical protein
MHPTVERLHFRSDGFEAVGVLTHLKGSLAVEHRPLLRPRRARSAASVQQTHAIKLSAGCVEIRDADDAAAADNVRSVY